MSIKRKQWKILVLIPVFLFFLIFLLFGRKNAVERIIRSGEVTVITRNNAHCYYTYRNELMGFEYDLAKAFSDYLGVKLKVITPTWEGLVDALNEEKGDFIAASLTIIPSREDLVDFSSGYLPIQQKAILHKNDYKIRKLKDLEGTTIHVRRGTSYEERLNELKNEGLDIEIKLYNDMPTEELIRMVAEKEIQVTVADSNIALLNRRYYPGVKIAFHIEEQQFLGWAVKKGKKALLKKINEFFKEIKKDGTFAKNHQKYYSNVEIFDYVDLKKYHQRLETLLPKYKGIIHKAAEKYDLDWRLIAAVIYQESHFDPMARSFTGVEGIMQLTQDTAMDMEIEDRLDPHQSIMGGARYLKKLYERYKDAKDPDRILIALASYNVGHRHILDAQRLAEERNLNPNSWSALEQTLPLLRYSKYYNKVKYGYCRGTEPVRYVERIMTYFDILKREAIS